MATLNNEEQAKHDRVAELETARRYGTAFVSDGDLVQARLLAEYATNNAEARERMEARAEAEEKAQQDRVQARRDAEATAASEVFLAQARHSYPGTDAEWQQDKAEILRQWRIQSALNTQNDIIARKRQMLGDVI
jgi:hypothetical protein